MTISNHSDEELCRLANDTDQAEINAGRDRPIIYGPYHVAALRVIYNLGRASVKKDLSLLFRDIQVLKVTLDDAQENLTDVRDFLDKIVYTKP